MITLVNQVSSAWFDTRLLRKSLHIKWDKFQQMWIYEKKYCEFISLIINSV